MAKLSEEQLAQLKEMLQHRYLELREEVRGELERSGIPATIQHDDLHGGNVFVGPTGIRFFDWGDPQFLRADGNVLKDIYPYDTPPDIPDVTPTEMPDIDVPM